MKVLVCCGNGAGTSIMIKRNVEKVTKKLSLNVQDIHHCAVSEAKDVAKDFDLILCSNDFIPMFDDVKEQGIKVVGLNNVLSAQEVEEALKQVL